ncbi:MAG: radical SAM protein [bacterium]|nr:radical SAM protein [bacterium]
MEFLLSKYNIFSKLKDSENYFIINLLSGNADIMSPEKASEILENNFTEEGLGEYIEKGYLVNESEEEKKYKLKYLRFLDNRESDEIQVFFVPGYGCNFSCTYCYQSEYAQYGQSPAESASGGLKKEVVDAFYSYIDREFAGKRKYITIFGGEPLMKGTKTRENIEWLIMGANERKLEIAVVTNGYYLEEYLDILSKGTIREIQVTLDGTREMHDKRRPLLDNSPTFEKIASGIDAALLKKFPINLRVVVDKENIDNLKELAAFAIDKKWTTHPLFKTQLGRNYELHTCQLDNEKLFSRVSLYEKIVEIVKEYPQFLEFHKPAFSVSRFLFENGQLPEPLFDSCPGTKTEWAFDYTGNIYSCTATVGKKKESLGTFFPTLSKKEDIIEEWEDRDVRSITDCKTCSLQLACGGGCASVAKNKTGKIQSPDCRPIKELLEMGIALYFKDEE